MRITRFETPGALRDAGSTSSRFYQDWHETVRTVLGGRVLDQSSIDVTPVAERFIHWTGFSRERSVLNTADRDDRRRVFNGSDDRSQQFEYLEWHCKRDRRGVITRVTFSTETPEYWRALAAYSPSRVLALYRALVSPAVQLADLFAASGDYQPQNRWNSRDGIVHYINGINTLSGAVSVTSSGVALMGSVGPDNYSLVASPGLQHAADPRVMLDAAGVARLGLQVALRDPIGIYIAGWDDTGWTKPDGSPVGDYWRIVRGSVGAVLRLEYEVPSGEGFSVGDIRIGGRRIEFGGQLAEHVTVVVGALAVTLGR